MDISESEDEQTPTIDDEQEATLKALVLLVKEARSKGQLCFNMSHLGLDSWSDQFEFFNFLQSYTQVDPKIARLNKYLPLSCPIFNFRLPANTTERPPECDTSAPTGKGSTSNLVDHIVPTYFRRIGDLDDSERTKRFDKEFKSEWKRGPADMKNLSTTNSVLSLEGALVDEETNEGTLNSEFETHVLRPITVLMRPAIPNIGVVSQLTGVKSTNRPGFICGHSQKVDLAVMDKTNYALVICEGKTVSVAHLLRYVDYDFSRQFESAVPFHHTPSATDISCCYGMMREGLGHCFAFGKEELVIHDCLVMHVIKFDFENIKVYNSMERARTVLETGSNPLRIHGEVAIVPYWSKTIRCSDYDPAMRKQIAIITWEEYHLRHRQEYKDRIARLEGALRPLWLKEQATLDKLYNNERINLRLDKVAGRYGYPQRSQIARHMHHFSFSTLQDGAYVNKVVQMPLEQCAQLLPGVKGDCKEVVIKLVDFFNVEQYYHSCGSDEVGSLDLEQFRQVCVDGFADEVECYLRIAHYTTPATREHLHTPKMLEYGACCIRDDRGNTLEGYYLVVEYIDGTKRAATQSELDDAVQTLGTMGIEHTDLVERNWIFHDGKLFVYDFNNVILD